MSKHSIENWVVTTTPALLMLTLLPRVAEAYVGPGAGVTAIGAVLSLIGAVLLSLVGFVWYPLRRLLRKRSAAQSMASRAANSTDPNVTQPGLAESRSES
jgi:hypothetical protein